MEEDRREYYFMNTFPKRGFSSVHILERKKERKKEKQKKNRAQASKSIGASKQESKQDKEEQTERKSVNIPSRNLIVHNLPDVGGDLSVSLCAIHLGHCTHLVLNLAGQKCGIRVGLGR